MIHRRMTILDMSRQYEMQKLVPMTEVLGEPRATYWLVLSH